MPTPKKYFTEEERKTARARDRAKYKASAKGAARAAHLLTPEGKAERAVYNASPERRATATAYNLRMWGVQITQEEVVSLHKKSCCEICGGAVSGKTQHIDHNHQKCLVRGVLCARCNSGLGHLERPGFIQAARSYLHKYGDELPEKEV